MRSAFRRRCAAPEQANAPDREGRYFHAQDLALIGLCARRLIGSVGLLA